MLGVKVHVLTSERKPAPAAVAADVHRRMLERQIDASGRTCEQICCEIGWEVSRLLRLP